MDIRSLGLVLELKLIDFIIFRDLAAIFSQYYDYSLSQEFPAKTYDAEEEFLPLSTI